VLVGVLAFRRPAAPPPAPAAAPADPAGRAPAAAAELQAALASGDAAALTAAGCPPEVARALAVGRAFDRLQQRMRALQPAPAADGRYWRRSPTAADPGDLARATRTERTNAIRDFSEAVRAAFGEDIESMFDGRDSRQSFLSAAKREQLRRIEQDYGEMTSRIYEEQGGIQLASDREKLKLLQTEKERDIAAALTPEEREQYALRASNTAGIVRARYGEALQTEEDYRRVFALQKAFDDRHADFYAAGPPPPEAQRARREAEQKLQADILAVIGPEAWAAAQRANDQDHKTAASLARRLNLPASTADSVLAARENYAAQSQQINANPALSAPERRAQLQGLAARAQAELQAAFGSEGAQAYAQRAQWLNLLRNGSAFSTKPQDSPGGVVGLGAPVHPVPPPRPAPPPVAPPHG
jgi:hypothetical protein